MSPIGTTRGDTIPTHNVPAAHLPRSTEGVQHTDDKLVRWHSLHDEALILNVADVCV